MRRHSPQRALQAIRALTELIIPKRCLICTAPLTIPMSLCPHCAPRSLKLQQHEQANAPLPPLITLSLSHYHGPLNEHLTLAKRGDITLMWSLAELTQALTPQTITEALGKRPELIAPIPPRLARLAQRGASLPDLIAQRVSDLLKTPTSLEALKRTQHTPPQSTLSRAARLSAQRGSLRASGVEGQAVLLIDDVMTTGATLLEAQRACLAAGASHVSALCLMRADLIENVGVIL